MAGTAPSPPPEPRPELVPQPEPAPFLRPDESARAERARKWLAVARGESANFERQREDKAR